MEFCFKYLCRCKSCIHKLRLWQIVKLCGMPKIRPSNSIQKQLFYNKKIAEYICSQLIPIFNLDNKAQFLAMSANLWFQSKAKFNLPYWHNIFFFILMKAGEIVVIYIGFISKYLQQLKFTKSYQKWIICKMPCNECICYWGFSFSWMWSKKNLIFANFVLISFQNLSAAVAAAAVFIIFCKKTWKKLPTTDIDDLQLRYLQTLNSISAEKNSTIVFPVPIDIISKLMQNSYRDNNADQSRTQELKPGGGGGGNGKTVDQPDTK